MKILHSLSSPFLGLALFLLFCCGGMGVASANTFSSADLSSLTLNCPSSMRSGVPNEASLFSCTQTAHYSDGRTQLVRQAATWSSANEAVLSIKSARPFLLLSGGFVETGTLASGVVAVDTPVAITGSYSENGVTVSNSATVTVIAQKLQQLATNCPATIYVGVPASCVATASYSDGTVKTVAADWLSSNAAAVTVSADCAGASSPCAALTPGNVSGSTSVTLTASYSENGVSKQAKAPLIVRLPPPLTSLVLTCPAQVSGNSGSSNIGSCVLVESYNGTSVNVSQTATWASSQANVLVVGNPVASATGALAGGGKLTSLAVAVDTPVTISASINWYGVSKTASATITVKAPLLVLTGLSVSCPSSVNAGISAPCQATAIYNDNSRKNVTANWASNNPAVARMSGNVLTAAAVSTDTTATITAAYSERGVAQSATFKVSISALAAGSCVPTLSSSSVLASAGGGDFSVSVAAGGACAWIANTTNSWLHLAISGGSGNGQLGFTVDPNSGAIARTGSINIGNQIYTVTQSAASTQPVSATVADCIFNWAEQHYPEQFFPKPTSSFTVGKDYYRFYTGSNSFLGTSNFELLKYVGPLSSGNVLDLGDLANWMATAGCQ